MQLLDESADLDPHLNVFKLTHPMRILRGQVARVLGARVAPAQAQAQAQAASHEIGFEEFRKPIVALPNALQQALAVGLA